MKTIKQGDYVLILHDDAPKSSGHNKQGRAGKIIYVKDGDEYPYDVAFEIVGTSQNYFKASQLKIISQKEYEKECRLFEKYYNMDYGYDEWRHIVLKSRKKELKETLEGKTHGHT